jgi:phosphoribosylamine--glycine ligase
MPSREGFDIGSKLLVVGSGGREHALAWKLASSDGVDKVFVAPGNAGTAREPRVANVPLSGLDELAAFAAEQEVAFTVVGPEAPLAAGIVDYFRQRGLRIFGPTRAAAQLEASKEYAKRFLVRHGIPTGAYAAFTDATEAHRYVATHGAPVVVKADGLAAGKGVVVAHDVSEAHAAIDRMLRDHALGAAGARLVIEEFLDGEEASFIVMCDGRDVVALASSQDHKRLLDGDRGPNTGGMGAYSPAPVVTPALHEIVMREIVQPTLQGMQADGVPYSGFLYAGLMIDNSGQPRVLEFNCRLGDPETQPILMRLRSPLAPLIDAAIDGRIGAAALQWDPGTSVGVVLAARGYPDDPRKGDAIGGLPAAAADLHVFHAGTALRGEQPVTNGGRVLCVTALGENVDAAQRKAYAAVERIEFAGMQFRHDIGNRGRIGWTAQRSSPT